MKKFGIVLAVCSMCAALTAPVMADAYFGVGVGKSTMVLGGESGDAGAALHGFVGNRVNENVAIEAFVSQMGEYSEALGYGYTGKISGNSVGGAIRLISPVSESVALYVKGGLHRWNAKLSVSDGYDGYSDTGSGTDPMFGVGASYDAGGLAVRLGYDRYMMDEMDVNILSVGLQRSF